jgi:hypothetical protein
MSTITDFFFDPTYHQITAINMHTILLLMLYIGISIGLISKKKQSSAIIIVLILVATVVVILMNFLVRWLCRNKYENIAWVVVVVVYLLHIGTGYNILSTIYKTKQNFNFKNNYAIDYNNNFDYDSDFNSMQYSMPPHLSSQMPPHLSSQMPPQLSSQMPPQMQSQNY